MTEPGSRLCPICRVQSMVSTLEVHHRKIPDSVWSRLLGGYTKKDKIKEELQKLTQKEANAEKTRKFDWWFCELCGYDADLEQYLRRFPS